MVKFDDISDDLWKKRLFIFDFDETVINLNLDWQRLKKELSLMVQEHFHINIEFTPILEKLELLRSQIGEEKFSPILKHIQLGEINAIHKSSTIQPVGFTLLKEIYSNIIHNSQNPAYIALLSNNFTETITLGAKKFGLDPYISYYVGRDMVKNIKPDTEGLELIHKHFPSVQKSEIVYFGDSPKYDRMVAESYGIDFYLITHLE